MQHSSIFVSSLWIAIAFAASVTQGDEGMCCSTIYLVII